MIQVSDRQGYTRASISLLLLYKLDFVLTKEKQTLFEPFNKFIKQN